MGEQNSCPFLPLYLSSVAFPSFDFWRDVYHYRLLQLFLSRSCFLKMAVSAVHLDSPPSTPSFMRPSSTRTKRIIVLVGAVLAGSLFIHALLTHSSLPSSTSRWFSSYRSSAGSGNDDTVVGQSDGAPNHVRELAGNATLGVRHDSLNRGIPCCWMAMLRGLLFLHDVPGASHG